MYKNVVIQAFEKAKKDIPGRSNKTNRSEHISTVLLNDFKYQISGKTLRNLLDQSVDLTLNADISIKSNYVENLCLFLGYADYQSFLKENSDDTPSNDHWSLEFIKKNKVSLIVFVLTIIIVLSITTFNQQRWMIWQDTHYTEVDFDANKYSLSQLKVYSQERIDDFLKVNPDCKTTFFNEDSSVNLWYGKNNAGEINYFTALAKHPETGKTLKEITEYMIRKYICESY
jgi:hypothetical protein